MPFTATALSEPLNLRVEYLDGKTVDYTTTPVDIWKTETFFGQTLAAMNGSYSAIAFMAYSVALRRGDAYRQRKQSTNPKELFEQWLDTIENVYVLTEQEETAEPTDPKEASNNGASIHADSQP